MKKKENTTLVIALGAMLLLFVVGAASFFLISKEEASIDNYVLATQVQEKEKLNNLELKLEEKIEKKTKLVLEEIESVTQKDKTAKALSPLAGYKIKPRIKVAEAKEDLDDNQTMEPGQTDSRPRKGFLDKAVIQRVVKRHINEIKYCYEKELVRTIGLKGKIIVSWLIKPNGKVSDVKISKTTLKSERVESCIIKKIKRWIFPKPIGGGDVKVKYPFIFKPA